MERDAPDRPTLPRRPGPRPPTMHGMPHMQIGVQPVQEVHAELFRRCFTLPGVENRPTVISIPGARALWLDDTVTGIRPGIILAGREFTHIHPDGSMHLTLPPERAREAVEAGWAEPHPMAAQMGADGMVLVYTPRTFDDLEVMWGLVLDAYCHVTGRPRPAPDRPS